MYFAWQRLNIAVFFAIYFSWQCYHKKDRSSKTEVFWLKKMFVLEHVEQIFTMFCKYVDQSGVCHVVKVALYKGK